MTAGSLYFRSCSLLFFLVAAAVKNELSVWFDIDGLKSLRQRGYYLEPFGRCQCQMFMNWTLPHFRTICLKYGLTSKRLSCKTMITTGFGHLFWDFCSSVDTPKSCLSPEPQRSGSSSSRFVPGSLLCSASPTRWMWWIYKRQLWQLFSWQIVECSVGAHSRAWEPVYEYTCHCVYYKCVAASDQQQRLESENKWWLCWCVCYMLMELQANAWPLLCFGDTTETRESH